MGVGSNQDSGGGSLISRSADSGRRGNPVSDIGVAMRPEVWRKKKSGTQAVWAFSYGLPEQIQAGDHLWVCLTDKWAGYFTIMGLHPDTWELSWYPCSWTDSPYPIEYEAHKDLHGNHYTHRVPALPLPAPCGKCGGPARVKSGIIPYERERIPDFRECIECNQREERCYCRKPPSGTPAG